MKEPLIIENLHLHIGDHMLISGGSVSLARGTKSALIGRNGSGKSTLLRAIAQHSDTDESQSPIAVEQGRISVPSDMTMQLIAQDPVLPETTAKSYIGAISPVARKSWERFAKAMGLFDLLPRRCSDLSGGQRMRVALGRAVASGANLLLFDEPTNNLDSTSIDALTRWVKQWPGTAVIVSHDRDFMDDVVSQVVEIDEEKKDLNLYGGNYSYYRDRKEEEIDAATKRYLQERSDRERLEADAKKKLLVTRDSENITNNSYVRSRMAKLAKGAKAQLGRIRRDLSSRSMPHAPRQPYFVVPTRDIDERVLLRLTDFSFSYPESTSPVLHNISASAYGGERILLSGDNGSGKSTLLRAISSAHGDSLPLWRAPDSHIAWCTQNTLDLSGFDDVFSYAASRNIRQSKTQLRTLIGAALNRDVGNGSTERLSVGERQRIALALLFAADPDIILLDEPTNHLDLITIELLEASLSLYRGTVIVATHDRRFIRNFMPDREWNIHGGTISEELIRAS